VRIHPDDTSVRVFPHPPSDKIWNETIADLRERPGNGAHGKRVVTAERKGQRTFAYVATYDSRNSLGDLGNEPRILEFSDGRVGLSRDIFELMVPIEFYNPTEILELIHKACVYQVYWAFVNSESVLNNVQKNTTDNRTLARETPNLSATVQSKLI
jgi:hypothetical protein